MFTGCNNSVSNNSEYSVEQIVDVSKLVYNSKNEIVDIFGEPTSVEMKKENIGDNYLFRDSFDKYNREILFYKNDDLSEYRLLFIDDSLQSFIYLAPHEVDSNAESIKFVNVEDIFKMFGIVPNDTCNKLNTSNQAANYEMVNDDVWRFEVGSIDNRQKTFEIVDIIFYTNNKPIEMNENNNEEDNSRIVYVTPSGKRYHFDKDCGGENANSTTLNKALQMALTPCNKCAY